MNSKPNTRIAMQNLLQQIEQSLPLQLSEAALCAGLCRGCNKKLIEYISTEVAVWQQRLNQGDVPNFGDLHNLARTARKVYKVLEKNGLMANKHKF